VSDEPVLEITGLKKYFAIKTGLFSTSYVHAVDDVSLDIARGETLGLVGESGSGKSTVARLAMRLIEPTDGAVYFGGRNIFEMSKREVRSVRRQMGMVFQDPASALNPKMLVRDLVGEPLRLHKLGKEEILERVKRALEAVNLLPSYMHRYPHELSGGEKQRVVIARALIVNPRLVIADEPTSFLDVSTQAQILELMKQLRSQFNFSCLFITHDLAVVRYISDRVAVMYLGKIMELASSRDLSRNPLHPYTKGLYSAAPDPNPKARKEIVALRGVPPSSTEPPTGCRFSTRCPIAKSECSKEIPQLTEIESGHLVACCQACE